MIDIDRGPEVPPEIIEFSRRLPEGMFTPLRFGAAQTPNGKEFVELIGRESDQIVLAIGRNPMIEISLGIVPFSDEQKIILSWLFLKLSGESEHIYEIGLNLGDPEHRKDLQILSDQPHYELILCGDTRNSITRVSLPGLGQDIQTLLDSANKYSPLSWSQEAYMHKLSWAHQQTSGAAELLQLVARGSMGIKEILKEG